jgi:hypothetical protein
VAFLEDRFGDWKPVSPFAGIGWLCFYALFLVYAAADRSGFLFLDYVNLMAHEAGHFFFSWFGYTVMILGGTLGELMVPLLCAAYFFTKRETPAVAFCSFWFFENFPYIGTYMADARAQALPLVGSGDHDWGILFGQMGTALLRHENRRDDALPRLDGHDCISSLARLAHPSQRPERKTNRRETRVMSRLPRATEQRVGQANHSVRNAAMGSSLVARPAGM